MSVAKSSLPYRLFAALMTTVSVETTTTAFVSQHLAVRNGCEYLVDHVPF
jgi:hypothetical protein